MREPLTTYLAVAALAVFVAWHWVAPSEQPVAPPGADATAVVAVPVEPEVPDRRTASDAVPAQRTEPGTGLGSVRGRIVDQLLQPIAGARAQLVLGEQTEGLPSAQTDGDGRFLVVGVPLTVCALRAEAPGRMPVQLGDLHPENLPDHDVDAGTFVLAPATSHHGQVRSRGRGLPGARVVLAPELGPPGRPVPVVQVTNTDEEGHFHFAVAPMPPSHLRATAAGHREAPVQKVTDPQQPIVVELTPLARCNGRVVDRATGAPLPSARVWAFGADAFADARLLPRPDLDPSSGTAVAADGSFALELPDARRAYLQVDAPGHCTAFHGPFDASNDVAGVVVTLQQGAMVRGTVTFRGEPVAARASLRPVDAPDEVAFVHTVGADGILHIAPVASGSWVLRVDGDAGARFEQRVEVNAPEPLSVDVTLAEGTRLTGMARRTRDVTTTVVCTHASGLQRRALVRLDGSYEVEGLFPGRWQARLEQETSLAGRIDSLLVDLLVDEAFEVGTAPLQRHDVAANEFRLGRIRGTVDPALAGSRIRLVPATAVQERVPAVLLSTSVGADGAFALDPVLPGSWRVALEQTGARVLETAVEVRAGTETTCVFAR